MKTLKWIVLTALMALLFTVAINGSLADNSADGYYLTIVQSELERSKTGLTPVAKERQLRPVTESELTLTTVQLAETYFVTGKYESTVKVDLSFSAELYNAKNVLDHIVLVTNTGNITGYVRTWFTFEMGELTLEEFKSTVILNRNTTDWTWGEFSETQIDGQRFAVICAEYQCELQPGCSTAPSLLQLLLPCEVTHSTVNRLDGNGDCLYTVGAYSQVISAANSMNQLTTEPWIKPQTTE